MNDSDWRIEIPSKLKEQLACLGYKVQEVADMALVVQDRVFKCPTRNEVFTLLDHKIDVSFASKVESEVNTFIQNTQTAVDSLKTFLSDNVSTIGGSIDSFKDANAKILEFEKEYVRLQRETTNVKTFADTLSAESRKSIAALQTEQGEIQKAIAGINDNVSSIRNDIASLTKQQSGIRDAFDDLKHVYQSDADQFGATFKSIRKDIEEAVARVPDIVSEAQKLTENNITALIKQDIARREQDIHSLNTSIQMMTSFITRIEASQATLLHSFEDMKTSAITEMQKLLGSTAEELRNYINDTFVEFTSLKASVESSMEEQKTALEELATFSETFQKADVLWKRNLEAAQKEVQAMFEGIQSNIEQDGAKMREALSTSMAKTTQAHKLLMDTNNTWNTEWKDREIIVDDTLTRLHRIVYDVDEAVANETSSRGAEIDVLRDAMERAFCTLHHQIDLKADADQVRRALWTKVDKLDA